MHTIAIVIPSDRLFVCHIVNGSINQICCALHDGVMLSSFYQFEAKFRNQEFSPNNGAKYTVNR